MGFGLTQSTAIPAFDLNFVSGEVMPAQATLARPSTSTRFNSALLQVTEAANVACFDYDPATGVLRGVLGEAAATNTIGNNSMVGAAPGSPGTAPTRWGGGGAGTRTIVGVGIESGIPYIDVRFVFSAAGSYDFNLESTTPAAAVAGQTWTASVFCSLVGGSMANITVPFSVNEASSTGTFLTGSAQNLNPIAGPLATQRGSTTRLLANASTAQTYANFRTAASGAADVTLRIGMPDHVQASAVTSSIPTTTAAATRAAVTLTTTLPYACDVLIQDRNGAEWRDGIAGGAYVVVPRTGQRHIGRLRGYAAGTVSPAMKTAMAVPA